MTQPSFQSVSQVRFPSALHHALHAGDWQAAKTWVVEQPQHHSVALAAALLNWAAGHSCPALLGIVWAMAPQALSGQDLFWERVSISGLRFAMAHEPLLETWVRRCARQHPPRSSKGMAEHRW